MIKIERKETEKTKQAIADLQKASENESSYNIESVNQALKEIFHGKCYICENKAVTSYQIEHLVPHRGDKTLKYDWKNLFWSCALKEVMHLHLSYFPVIVIFGLGILTGIALVIKLIRRALENHRSAMIYFVIGMMIGSLYAIVMGPTTLENTKAAMTLHTFHPVFFIIGIVIVFGLEKIKAIAE